MRAREDTYPMVNIHLLIGFVVIGFVLIGFVGPLRHMG